MGVSSPGRRVTILGKVLERIGATTFPPRAGFSWTSRPSSSISKSMASPVSPNANRAATRDARSRPLGVEAKRTAYGWAWCTAAAKLWTTCRPHTGPMAVLSNTNTRSAP